eukprot:12890900-Prorocentrum_lima.AAC.1
MKADLLSKPFTAEGALSMGLIFCIGCCLFQEYLDIATSNMLDTKEESSWDTILEAKFTALIQFMKE